MPLRVFKYDLPMQDKAKVRMPRGARLLHVAAQSGCPRLWALVDENEPPCTRLLRVAGTGHQITPADANSHVGTFFAADGQLVFHVFDCGEEW